MRFLDLCAGIGGFSLGLEWAGMTCAGQVEIEPFCIKVLEKHWPQVPRWKDLKDESSYHEYPAVDLVCGGYPCQPFSHAGQRRGAEDDRHLWPYVFKVVQRLRPAWCLFENVAGHVTLGLDTVLADLEGEGYACRPVVVPACAIDAPHRRDRVWIVAYSERSQRRPPQSAGHVADGQAVERQEAPGGAGTSGADGGKGIVANSEGFDGRPGLCMPRQAGNGRRQPCDCCCEVDAIHSNTNSAGCEKLNASALTDDERQCSRISVADNAPDADGERELQPKGCVGEERGWIGNGGWWLPEPGVGRVAHGISQRVAKLKALGNAVVPQVVMQFGLAIMAAHHERRGVDFRKNR